MADTTAGAYPIRKLAGILAGAVLVTLLVFIVLIAGLLGWAYLDWNQADPARAIPQLTLPQEVTVIESFEDVATPPGGPLGPNVAGDVHGVVFTSTLDEASLAPLLNRAFQQAGWRTDPFFVRGYPGGSVEVELEPLSANAYALFYGAQPNLDPGERLYVLFAYQTTFLD
ncbi:MAG: hypothetical protein ACFB51_11560 [Anaerolineae bacterium]